VFLLMIFPYLSTSSALPVFDWFITASNDIA
jgi:hypothetical protein